MKWYFAARTSQRATVKAVCAILKRYDQKITFDWTVIGSLAPFESNAEKCGKMADKIYLSISKSDVFVLISDSGGTDMLVELGIAISGHEARGKPRIYIVGKHNKRSIMHLYHGIRHAASLEDVILSEGIGLETRDLNKISAMKV
jgi:hypothetical protein